MTRKLRKRFGRGIHSLFIKWTWRLLPLSSATTSSSPEPFIVENQLPNELIQCILDHLYCDTPTLLNCALVARFWAVPSQRGIFREIVLKFPHFGVFESARSMKTKYRLFTRSFRKIDATLANPRLASYVQSLKLYNFGFYSSGEAIVDSLHAAAARIVHRLSKVNKVQLSAPSLTQVYLSDFSLFTLAELSSLLGHATHLKVLHVEKDRHSRDGLSILQSPVEESGAPQSIQLDQLGFGRYFARFDLLLTWLQQDWCPFDVRNVRVLRIGPSPEASEMVRYLGRNLRELELLAERGGLPWPINDFLEHIPNLHSLTLHIIANIRYTEALFEPLRLPNPDGTRFSLQHLTVNFMFYSAGTFLDHQNLCEQWAVLDAMLERPEFPLLEMVHIRLIEDKSYTIPDEYRELYRRTFSSLERSGKLMVSRLKIATTASFLEEYLTGR
ncbi:hypothetical protein BT96DRAFT_1023698 [Gymnopus androsaceus JB14]|uniref:F-box domain-containing protein n=1 Tax=Gymnopus androsaceus JB14 TaxID=1447944 RepID=A0A6A4H4D4_9AGAR|nr:hypothetical protein BT96DRAFT_1023698 [Gymnopus androsaceus JB14]